GARADAAARRLTASESAAGRSGADAPRAPPVETPAPRPGSNASPDPRVARGSAITLGGRERVPMAMRKRLFQPFTVVGAINTGIFALVIFASIIKCASSEDVPDTSVLELRLDRPLAPGPADPLSLLLGEKGPGLIDVIAALERAGDDD